ncbi:MAG: branched-chain amino acid ABC transporter permease [Clostridia bacterium]|nr:branched-chain amino acid ABC transporter permease [Clostridia bacterium]
MTYLLNTLFATLVPMCVTAMVTMAITLIFKTSSTTNFAQGVISAFGAYFVSYFMGEKVGLSIWIAMPIGVIASTLVAVLIDVGIFRRGRYVNAVGKQIITMGLISIIVSVIPMIFGMTQPSINKFVSGNVQFKGALEGLVVTNNALTCVGITVAVLGVIFILLRFSKWGLTVRATASNEYVAGMMGINTHVVTAITWGLAGALGALAATMLASENASISVYFMTNYQVYAFLAGILGGFATFYGPVIAGVAIPLINGLVIWALNMLGLSEYSGWSMVIVYAIALIIIFFKPQGLFGKRIAKKV